MLGFTELEVLRGLDSKPPQAPLLVLNLIEQ